MTTARLMAWVFASGVAGFFAWWREELAGLAPKGMRQALRRTRNRRHRSGSWTVRLVLKRKPRRRGKVLPADPRKAAASFPRTAWSTCFPKTARCAANAACRAHRARTSSDIMNLQMASETPFTVDEVYTDSIITGEDDATREIIVSQALAPRPAIDAIVERMREIYGIEPRRHGHSRPVRPRAAPASTFSPSMTAPPAGRAWLPRPTASAGCRCRRRPFRRPVVARPAATPDRGRRHAHRGRRRQGGGSASNVNDAITNGIAGIQTLSAATQQRSARASCRSTISSRRCCRTGPGWKSSPTRQPVATITGLPANSATLVEAMESSDLVAISAVRFAGRDRSAHRRRAVPYRNHLQDTSLAQETQP